MNSSETTQDTLSFEDLEIDLNNIPLEDLPQYIAVKHFFKTLNEVKSERLSKSEKVQPYLESFYHLCDVKCWEAAYKVVFTPLGLYENNHLSLQLDIWGYFRDEIFLGKKLLNQISIDTDIECLIIIGDGYIDLGKYKNAISTYHQGLELSRQINSSEKEIRCLSCIGLVLFYQGKYLEAIQYFQQALDKKLSLSEVDVDYLTLKAKALSNLALCYYNLDYNQKSLDCNQEGLKLFRQLDDNKGISLTLISLARDHYALAEYQVGLELTQEAFEITQKLGYSSGEAEALNLFGLIHQAMGNSEQAIDCHKKQIEISQEIGDLREEAYALGNLSIIHEDLGQYSQSAAYAQLYLHLAREIGDLRAEGAALHALGAALLGQSQFSVALSNLNVARKIFSDVNSRSEEAQVCADLSVTYLELGDKNSALELCDQAISIAKDLEMSLADECKLFRKQILDDEP